MPSTQHETVITLAQRHINAKDYSAAVSVLAPHVRDHPEDVDALNVIALAHFQMAKFPAARSAYLQMWSIAPIDIRAMYGMGMTLQKLGQLDEAAHWFEATLVVEPGFERAALRLIELRALQASRPSAAPEPGPGAATGPRRLTNLMIPEDEEEMKAYRRASRERARIDMMNEHWHAIPWPIRVLQVAGLVAVIVAFFVPWYP